MFKIFRTIGIIVVLVGLLAWGVTAFAVNASTSRISDHATRLQGHSMENGIPVSRDQIRPVGQ